MSWKKDISLLTLLLVILGYVFSSLLGNPAPPDERPYYQPSEPPSYRPATAPAPTVPIDGPQEILMREGNTNPISDERWALALREGTVVSVKLWKELSLRVTFSAPKVLDAPATIDGWCKVTDNWAGEQWGREILTYHFDRFVGFYLTPPAVHRELNFVELSKSFPEKSESRILLDKLIVFAEKVREKRMKTQPSLRSHPAHAAVIGWINGTSLALRSLDNPTNERDRRAAFEFHLFTYLTACKKIDRSHFHSGSRWLMIDNDRCFRERQVPMPVPPTLKDCVYPQKIVQFLQNNEQSFGAQLRNRVMADPAPPFRAWIEQMESHNLVSFNNTQARVTAFLGAVRSCGSKLRWFSDS